MDKIPLSPSNPINGTFAAVLDQMNLDIGETAFSPTARPSLTDKYLGLCMHNIIDDVCLHHQKISEIKKEIEKNPSEALKFELEHIPHRSVPLELKPDDPYYRTFRKVKLENEQGRKAGLFGWCFVCRRPADLYCKDTRIPVCSLNCKLRHSDDLGIFIHKSFTYLCRKFEQASKSAGGRPF